MKFLIDEDIPLKLLKTLLTLGHDCVRATPASSDLEVVERAEKEERILITLDKDFTNITIYPPTKFNIVRIQIHPPYADTIIEAFQKLLNSVPAKDFQGLIILQPKGHIRVIP